MRRLYNFILRQLKIFEILRNQEEIKNQTKIIGEIHKAQIFNSTIIDSEWLKFKSFSPGGWAADYGLLCTLYRALNGMKPRNILEFGLGQSSKIVHQYADFFKVNAVTCEHDENWIDFFKESKDGNYAVNILKCELLETKYKGQDTLTYKNIPNVFDEQEFDFILVDGPFGQEHYSRPQIIEIAKNNIAKNFCIIIDDYEREGEKETANEIFSVLRDKNIDFCHAIYSSEKQHILICSENLKFLTSL